jgi:hypothetical protein
MASNLTDPVVANLVGLCRQMRRDNKLEAIAETLLFLQELSSFVCLLFCHLTELSFESHETSH